MNITTDSVFVSSKMLSASPGAEMNRPGFIIASMYGISAISTSHSPEGNALAKTFSMNDPRSLSLDG